MPSAFPRRIVFAAAAVSAACLAGAGLTAPAFANPAGTDVVIDEVFGGGGNSGAPFANDYVELYNPTSAPISLAGWSVAYYAKSGNTGGSTPLTSSIPAHGYYLIGEAAGSNTSAAALPTADASGNIAMSATDGSVVLKDASGAVADAVAFGAGVNGEGSPMAALSNSKAGARTTPGADTDNNSADFGLVTPAPKNSSGSDDGGDPGTGDPGNPGDPGSGTVTIAQIQGTNTDTSPLNGQSVTTTGVVTAVYATGGFNGFFLETGGAGGTAADDKTPGASDAVFVYGSNSAKQVHIGDSVSVTGTVQEYQGETEISSPTVTALATALPAVVPDRLAWSDLGTDAEKEAHEGELIAPQGDFTVDENYNTNFYGEVELAAGDQLLRQPTDVGSAGSAAAQAQVAYNAAHQITLDDGSSTVFYPDSAAANSPLPWLTATNTVSIGATATFNEPVVLDYRNSLWKFQPDHVVSGAGTDVVSFSDVRSQRAQPDATGGRIKLATFNVENYFTETGDLYGGCSYYDDRAGNHIAVDDCGATGPRGAADATNLARQQAKIVTGINGLDASIVSLEEIENSVKFGKDRDQALSTLVDALNAAAGSTVWAYAPSPAAADLPATADQDVIRTAFIYKPANVSLVGASHVLSNLSGAGQDFSIAREPLAQGFKAAGAQDSDAFLVVANHLKSKSNDATGLYPGDEENTDPASDQGGYNVTRTHQAQDSLAFANEQATALGTDKIFMVGDFNAYTHEDPMEYLYSQGYTDLGSTYDPSHWSYTFDGLQGSMDHVLASPAAAAMVTGATVWQINAQESVGYAYSRYNYDVTQLFDANDPFAASDHDPVIVGLNPPVTAAAPVLSFTTPNDGATVSGTVPVSVSVSGDKLQAYNLRVDSAGLQYAYQPKAGTQTFQLDTTTLSNGVHTLLATATDAAGAKTTITEKITVDNPTLAWVTPNDGATVSGTIPVSVALGGTVQAYNLRVDSTGLQYAAQPKAGTQTFQLDTTTLSNGTHTLLATATNAAGTKVTITEKITVDNAPSTTTTLKIVSNDKPAKVEVDVVASSPTQAIKGTAKVTIYNPDGSKKTDKSASLKNGSVVIELPSGYKAGSYTLVAEYKPGSGGGPASTSKPVTWKIS
jgi:5'-nucleotidase